MTDLLILILVISWLGGFALNEIGGGLIHLLLVIAVIVLAARILGIK